MPPQPTLLVSIGADFTQFDKDMKDVGRHLKPFQDVLNNVGSALTKTITVPLAAVTAGLYATARSAGKSGDEIAKMIDQTGLSAKQLQELRYVASQTDVQFGAITASVGMLTRKLFSADDEGKASSKILKDLGVNVKDADGKYRSMNDIFPEVINRLSRITNETERSAIASQIFGRGFMEMKPLFKLSADEMAYFIDRAHKLGLVISAEGVESADLFEHKLDELKQQFGSLFQTIGMAVIPVLMTGLIPAIQNNLVPALKSVIEFVTGLIKGFGQLPGGVQIAIVAILGIGAAFGPLLLGLAQFIRLMPFVISAFTALGAAVPWLVGLAVVVGVLGSAWLKLKVQEAEAAAANKAMNDEMVRQAETLGDLKNKDLPGYIEGLKQVIANAKAAKAAIEAKYQPTTRTVRSDREGNVFSVTTPAVITPDDLQKMKELDLLIQGATATINKFNEAKKTGTTASKNLTDQEKAVNDIMTELDKQLHLASERFQIFFNHEEFTKQKSDALRTAIEGLLAAGIDPMDKSITKLVDDLIKVEHPMEKLKDAFMTPTKSKWDPKMFMPIVAGETAEEILRRVLHQMDKADEASIRYIDDLGRGFAALGNGLSEIGVQANSLISKLLVGIQYAIEIAKTIAEMNAGRESGFAGGLGIFGSILGIAGTLLGLSSGGIITGPTLAMVGESPASNPEVVAPLSTLSSFLSPQGPLKVIVEGRISGRDIYLTSQNYKNGMGRQ